jgi:sporulation protein YlmC with PRC-barrel domain
LNEHFYGDGSVPLTMQGLEELVGLELISSDARAIGTVEGAAIDASAWTVKAIRVGLRRGIEKLIDRQKRLFTLDRILISTENLGRVSDAVIMRQPLTALKDQVLTEDEKMMPAGAFIGMRVMCDDAVFLGHVDNILIETGGGWRIPFIQVKLSREAKGLWERGGLAAPTLVNVSTQAIGALGDMVILTLSIDQVREGSEREGVNALNAGVA